jgi:hypothetical protein
MITQDRLRELFDYTGGEFVRRTNRGGQKAGTVAGTKDSYGYVQFSVDGHLYLAHRAAWLYAHGEWPPFELDHINGDRSDNRIDNLRPSDRLHNTAHRHTARSDSKTGSVGVSIKRGKYIARLQFNGQRRFLGEFDGIEAASSAYRAARAVTNGVFTAT